MKAVIYPDAAGEWRFHIRAANGEIIAHGESYIRRTDAESAVHLIFQAGLAPVQVEIHGRAGEITHSYAITPPEVAYLPLDVEPVEEVEP